MRHLALLSCVFFLTGCGTPSSSPSAVQTATRLNLILFGAPNCAACNTEIPQMQSILKSKLGSRYAHLGVTVYVLNGTNNSRPTIETAQEYKDGFSRNGTPVDFNFVPDGWVHKTYRDLYPYQNGQDTLPAAAIKDGNGLTVITYTPGSVSPDQIADFINSRLQ